MSLYDISVHMASGSLHKFLVLADDVPDARQRVIVATDTQYPDHLIVEVFGYYQHPPGAVLEYEGELLRLETGQGG